MRSTIFFTALLASISAISALPILSSEGSDLVERGGRNLMTSPRITYYAGKQLNNPACGGPSPNDHSMIAAVKQGSFKCGDRIHIQHGSNAIVVKVVDFCPSCSAHSLDLTPGAFSQLANLDQGVISGAKMYVM